MPMLNRKYRFVHQWKFVNFRGGTWPLHVCSIAFWCLPKSHRAMEKGSCHPSDLLESSHYGWSCQPSNHFGRGRITQRYSMHFLLVRKHFVGNNQPDDLVGRILKWDIAIPHKLSEVWRIICTTPCNAWDISWTGNGNRERVNQKMTEIIFHLACKTICSSGLPCMYVY